MSATSVTELLTTEEVAEYLRVPVGTLRNWRVMRKGPTGFRIGKRVVYRRENVEAWVSEQERAEVERAAL